MLCPLARHFILCLVGQIKKKNVFRVTGLKILGRVHMSFFSGTSK